MTVSWAGLPCRADIAIALNDRAPWRAAGAAVRAGSIGRAMRWFKYVAAVARAPRGQPWREYSAIRPELAARVRLRELMTRAGHDPTFMRLPGNDRAARFSMLRPGRHVIGAYWAELAAAAHLSVRDPTQDVRLLRFVVGVPNRHWRGLLNRWLIREAMQGWLPDPVRLSSQRGRQAADLVPRLAGETHRVAASLSEIADAPRARAFVDLDYLSSIHRRLHEDSAFALHRSAATVLVRGIAVGVFIARQGTP
jgi:hypothetical protein